MLSSSEKIDLLYHEYAPYVRSILFRMAGSEHLDDLTQDVFVKVIKGFPLFSFRSSVKTWVSKVSVNVAIDFLRKQGRFFEEELEEVPMSDFSDDIEISDLIDRAMSGLSTKHRAVVVLHFFQEMPIKEIAKILDESAGTIKSRLHHAKKRLEEFLKNNGVRYESK